jgi:hypothetical protein
MSECAALESASVGDRTAVRNNIGGAVESNVGSQIREIGGKRLEREHGGAA